MLAMNYPSRWRNKKTGQVWLLTWNADCSGNGKPGVEATQEGGAGSGKIYWTAHGGKLDLQYVIAQPRRTGLGSLLTFAFAKQAVDDGHADVKIASANPTEHGFYKHMGFVYDRAMLDVLTEAARQGGEDEMVRLWQPVQLPDDDGHMVTIVQAHLACELSGTAIAVKAKSETSAEKTWELVG